MNDKNENLSIRQKKLLRALIDYQSPLDALAHTGIATSTYLRWLDQPEFIQALKAEQEKGIAES